MSEAQIQQIYTQINQILEIPTQKFSLRQLCNRKWYVQVLAIIYPSLSQKLQALKKITSEQAAIDKILLILAEEQVIQQDFLQIKGRDIVIGDVQSIFYIVQLFMALVQKQLQEDNQNQEEGEEYDQEGQEEEQGQDQQQQQQFKQSNIHNQNMHNNNKKPNNNSQVYNQNVNQKPIKVDRQNHSVLGIKKEFENQQSQEDYFVNQKQFNSKLKADNQQSQESNQIFKGLYDHNQKNPKKNPKKQKNTPKLEKQTNYKTIEQYDSDQNIGKTLNRYKSLQNLTKMQKSKDVHMNFNKPSKNATKKMKKLVNHPVIQKQYPKATTVEEKKMTKQVKKVIKQKRKPSNKENQTIKTVTSQQAFIKKKRQLKNFMQNDKKQQKLQTKMKNYDLLKEKNSQKLKRLLKWKQANLQRQKQELQQTMQMKVQLKKQNYMKQINNLILTLEKKRALDKKRQEQQKTKKQKQLADKRLQAIQTQYKTQMKLLKQKSQQTLNKKAFNHTDHRSIIQGLQRQLKKQNEKQLSQMKLRFRREQVQIQDDLQKLQRQIMKAYMKN